MARRSFRIVDGRRVTYERHRHGSDMSDDEDNDDYCEPPATSVRQIIQKFESKAGGKELASPNVGSRDGGLLTTMNAFGSQTRVSLRAWSPSKFKPPAKKWQWGSCGNLLSATAICETSIVSSSKTTGNQQRSSQVIKQEVTTSSTCNLLKTTKAENLSAVERKVKQLSMQSQQTKKEAPIVGAINGSLVALTVNQPTVTTTTTTTEIVTECSLESGNNDGATSARVSRGNSTKHSKKMPGGEELGEKLMQSLKKRFMQKAPITAVREDYFFENNNNNKPAAVKPTPPVPVVQISQQQDIQGEFVPLPLPSPSPTSPDQQQVLTIHAESTAAILLDADSEAASSTLSTTGNDSPKNEGSLNGCHEATAINGAHDEGCFSDADGTVDAMRMSSPQDRPSPSYNNNSNGPTIYRTSATIILK